MVIVKARRRGDWSNESRELQGDKGRHPANNMQDKKINYHNSIYVLLMALLLLAFSVPARGNISFYQDRHGPPEKKIYLPVDYNFSQGSDLHRADFKSKVIKREPGNTGDGMFVDLKVGYGRLFSPSNDGYMGFGYFTAKADSDNRLRFNSSLGHFLPLIDGELFLTHRLLRSNISSPLQDFGAVDGKVYENSFSANYTRYSNGFLRETSLNYSFSTIPGQEFTGRVLALDAEDSGYTAKILGGFSDTTTHEIAAQIAFGSENMGFDFISGFKTSLHVGYEHVEHGTFHDNPGQVLTSFSALAAMEQQTSAGLIKTSYRHVETSRTFTAGYSVGGVELYAKNIQYKDREDTQLFGLRIKLDLDSFGLPFRQKSKRLFRKAIYAYDGLGHLRHNSNINSDHLTTKPSIRKTISTW